VRRGSIRWRMMLAGGLAILTALALAAAGLALLFDRHVQRLAREDLQNRARAIAGLVEPGRAPSLREVPLDPAYEQVFSGHYWQLRLGDRLLHSRSLWDYSLPMSDGPPAPGTTRSLTLPGPQGEPLLVFEQGLLVGRGAEAVPLQILVARNRRELDAARAEFLGDLLPYLSLLGALLLAASYVQVTVGLRPLAQVGARVAQLGSGARPRIGTDMPAEVIPLAREIDTLLDARDDELTRARHRAADLAHGFKTPLQALMGDARLLRESGQADVAGSIETIALAMRRHVDRELARARLQTETGNSSADPGPIILKLVEVLKRTPMGAMIDWQIDCPAGLRAGVDPDDLTEALGALMENAMRHARERVGISARPTGRRVLITLRDDGPGVPEAGLDQLTRRGLSLDPQGDGQGIGLAVAAGVIDAAHGRMTMRNAHPGLEVQLEFPAAGP
jgi:signal transduction histidine kinase